MLGDNEEYYTEDAYGEELDNSELFNQDGRISGFQIGNVVECSRYFGPEWLAEQEVDKSIFLKRGLYAQNGKLLQSFEFLVNGFGNREIARRTGCTTNTIRKYRNVLETLLETQFLCKCGKLATHREWCSHRIAQSLRQQRFLNRGKNAQI